MERRCRELERQLDAIKAISRSLANHTEASEIVRESLEVAVATLHAEAGAILLGDRATDRLAVRYATGPRAEELIGQTVSLDEAIAGDVFKTGKPRITEAFPVDLYPCQVLDRGPSFHIRSMLSVPLRTLGGSSLGVMEVQNRSDGTFDECDLELLCVIASQAATIIYTARLHQEARLASVVRAMGDISHDIKNMLTPVITAAQTLDDVYRSAFGDLDAALAADGDTAEGVRRALAFLREFHPEAIEMILEGAEDVQARVRQLADCVKGQITPPHFEILPFEPLVGKVFRALAPVAQRRGVALVSETPADLPPFSMDSRIMYSAVYNLVNNALDATPKGGSVTVRAAVETPSSDSTPGLIAIEVEDTGRGIPEEIRRRLFTDDTISAKVGGTGLGTKIVRNAAEAHGGSVGVRSELGKGSVFTLRLPMTR